MELVVFTGGEFAQRVDRRILGLKLFDRGVLEEQPRQRPYVLTTVGVVSEDLLHCARQVGRATGESSAGGRMLLEDGAYEVVLVTEVAVNEAEVDLGVGCDIAQRCRGAAAGEVSAGGGEYCGPDFVASRRFRAWLAGAKRAGAHT